MDVFKRTGQRIADPRDLQYMGMMGLLSNDPGMSATGKTMIDAATTDGSGSDWKFTSDSVLGGGIWYNPETGESMYADLPQAPEGYNPVTRTRALPQSMGAVEGNLPPAAGRRESATAGQDEKRTASTLARLAERSMEIAELVQEDPEAAQPGFFESVAEGMGAEQAANWMRSPERQQVSANYAGIIDDVLWLITGAAYNEEQRAAQYKMFVPNYTDDPATVAAKRDQLVNFIEKTAPRAGRAFTPEVKQQVLRAIDTMYGSAGAPLSEQPSEQSSPSGPQVYDWNAIP